MRGSNPFNLTFYFDRDPMIAKNACSAQKRHRKAFFISISIFECKLGKYPTCLHTDFVRYFVSIPSFLSCRYVMIIRCTTYFYVSYYFSIFRNTLSSLHKFKARASKALSFGLLAGMAFGKMSSNSKGHPEPGTYHQVTQIQSARLATERICKFCLGMACISLGFLAPVIWDG